MVLLGKPWKALASVAPKRTRGTWLSSYCWRSMPQHCFTPAAAAAANPAFPGIFLPTALHLGSTSCHICLFLQFESWILNLMMTDPHFACAEKKPWTSSVRKWLQGQQFKGLVEQMIKHLGQQECHMLIYGDKNCKEHIHVLLDMQNLCLHEPVRMAARDG